MLTKLETKSNRVKGLSFHPTRPWILASLHNGIVQLWDYRIKTLVDKFDEHDGPVRGVCFHPTQPLFVSGGDDYKIKVWNYKQRRCLFTLLGHLDYIRTVEFHREYPWILSASDDQTIRIWNWQSRTCIAVLTGHNHYVMCASFHPKEDLVVSASLDQTVRVWDISGLRKKSIAPSSHSIQNEDNLRMPQNELFGNADAIVKYVLEGHDRGVNWAAFHPSSPLIVSGADDRQVKLWRMNDTKAWEVDTFRGHFNNVSCSIFHPRQDLILSNSEDKTIRVWDIAKRTGIHTFRREHDRFWILAAHPELNLFAAGHDSGMIVFKLERERPAYCCESSDIIFYVKDKYVRSCEVGSNRDVPIIALRSRSSGSSSSASTSKFRYISFSNQDRALLLASDAEGGFYELYLIPKDSRNADAVESKRGTGLSAVFFARKRFAVLDKSQQIVIKNLKNEETKRITAPHAVDALFAGPLGTLLLRSEDKVTLYDVQQKKSLGEISTPEIRSVHWSNEKSSFVALIGKECMIIANRKLEELCRVQETIRIKSGAWDENGVFLYSTSNHIKFCLPNGDNGIVRTLDSTVYITAVKGNRVYCLDRDAKVRVISIDPTEYLFKQALIQRKYSTVLKMVKEYNLIGQSIISYLQKKGFPEVALYFVKDEKTRFNLAIECGNIEVALESAKQLDDKEAWNTLALEALRQGNHQIVEMAYQRIKNFERLSFLYLITGNVEKLKKMMKISEMRNDAMSGFHNALYLGDVRERIKILEEVGQVTLAYVTARTHQLTDLADALRAKLPPNVDADNIAISDDASCLLPPIPIMRLHENNWPLLSVTKGYFDGPIHDEEKKFMSMTNLPEDEQTPAQWADVDIPDDDDDDPSKSHSQKQKEERDNDEDEGAPANSTWEIDLDLGQDADTPTTSSNNNAADKAFVILPNAGPSIAQVWTSNSMLAADHAAAGSFESAMKLLHQQIGVVNFAPLKPFFMKLYNGSRVYLGTLPTVPGLPSGVSRNIGEGGGPRASLPLDSITIQPLIDDYLKAGYRLVTAGPSKFQEALNSFMYILHAVPFLVADNKKSIAEVKELIGLSREYVIGLKMELVRKDVTDPVRQVELAAYFTHCNLQQIHLVLSLRSAMSIAYKVKNYLTAAAFARRLLEFDPAQDVATQARKVIKFAEQNSDNAHKLNYDERNPFVICGHSFTPIYKGNPTVNCPHCGTSYLPEYKDKLCNICGLSQIGKQVSGLQLLNERSK